MRRRLRAVRPMQSLQPLRGCVWSLWPVQPLQSMRSSLRTVWRMQSLQPLRRWCCGQLGLRNSTPRRCEQSVQSMRRSLQPLCTVQPLQPLCGGEPMQPVRALQSLQPVRGRLRAVRRL